MPFKTAVFRAAIISKLPIVPICISDISNKKIKLGRWINGLIIIEVMKPINVKKYTLKETRQLAFYCHSIIKSKFDKLNSEIDMKRF